MSDLMLDPTGDLLISNGDTPLNADLESIRQHLQIRLRFFLGEWFLDTDQGVPYFQQVFTGSPSADALAAIFKKAITYTDGVTGLSSFTMSLDRGTRQLTISFQASSDFGLLDFTTALLVGG